MKSMLILAGSGLTEESQEVELIKSQVELYKIDSIVKNISSFDDLIDSLNDGVQYDYIYLSAHGDEIGFSNESDTLDVTWSNFGELLFKYDCLKDESQILLSCCRGGLNDVAYDLINFCPRVSYVMGPRSPLTSSETVIGFNIYLYNLEIRRLDPIISAEKIRSSTDLRFLCFDRLEVITEPAYLLRAGKYDIKEIDLDADGKADERIIRAIRENEITYTDDQAEEHVKSGDRIAVTKINPN